MTGVGLGLGGRQVRELPVARVALAPRVFLGRFFKEGKRPPVIVTRKLCKSLRVQNFRRCTLVFLCLSTQARKRLEIAKTMRQEDEAASRLQLRLLDPEQ